MTEAMPFLQKYDITFLRPPLFGARIFSFVQPTAIYTYSVFFVFVSV